MSAFLRGLIPFIVVAWPAMSAAQPDPAEDARAAANMLEAASAQLEEAQSARDRVRALTKTISAFEEGLTVLRGGMRRASLREADLSVDLQSREDEIATLLSVLLRVGSKGSPVILLHPGGPTGTARSGMMLSDMIPALNDSAEDLRRDFAELKELQELQAVSAEHLETGLTQLQTARSDLSQAIADRTTLPKRFVADPVREAILLSSVQTLDGFAAGLDLIPDGVIPSVSVSPANLKGELDLPVHGTVLRNAGEADAAGVVRPGIILETLPNALVTSPLAASLRYVGPLLDFGQVVILEPSVNVIFVIAGLETVYAETGDMIEAGAPLGLMGDAGDKNADELSTDGDETGTDRSETLYIEVRQNNKPEDPSLWFLTDKDG